MLDVKQANALLDKIGLAKKNTDRFRLRTDKAERLRILVIAIVAFLPYPKLAEMVAEPWRKIGIQADVREMERGSALPTLPTTTPAFRLEQRRDRVAAIASHLGHARRSRRRVWSRLCGVVIVRRRAGTKPNDPNVLKIFDLYAEAAGLEAEGRTAMPRRSGRSWSISSMASARSGNRRRASVCGWFRTGWAISAARVCNAQHCRTPGNSHPETWYLKA